jgi:peroxiredoxin Q/BCP
MAKTLMVGSKAPAFKVKDQDGRTVTLSDFRGKTVVLYFYPKDDTPGCTKEACGFRDGLTKFRRLGAEVIGVSFDSPASHTKFRAKYKLPFTLLSDEEKKVAEADGVYVEKSMYGRKVMGIRRSPSCWPDGRIAAIFPKVKTGEHAAEVLEALKEILIVGRYVTRKTQRSEGDAFVVGTCTLGAPGSRRSTLADQAVLGPCAALARRWSSSPAACSIRMSPVSQ